KNEGSTNWGLPARLQFFEIKENLQNIDTIIISLSRSMCFKNQWRLYPSNKTED
ncbi:unnamed protein product, partial [Arabidopsis halleri]